MYRIESAHDLDASDDHDALAAPGKRTLTARLPVSRAVQRVPAVGAASAAMGGVLDDPCWFAPVAAAGVAGAGGPLPHLPAIQRAFGPHDVSGVRAHVGGDAALAASALGARAYATGHDVGFADTPDLFTAAHEAAHVVQQRGGVQLAGGVGVDGDPYERHADAVAERVVRGESAADLLATGPAGGGGGPAVQRRIGELSRKSEASEVEAFLARVVGSDVGARAFLRELIGDDTPRTEEQALEALRARGADPAGSDAAPAPARDRGDDVSARFTEVLGELLASGRYVFSNPPFNSSGDIYHTVGFIAVMVQAHLPPPHVYIGYDPPASAESDTYRQAQRAVEFATALGFGAYVHAIEVKPGKSSQPNPKAKATREAITRRADLASEPRPTILDQKVSTALIAYLMQKFGRTQISRMIRAELTQYPATTDPAVQVASDAWIEAQMAKIRAACPDDNRLILFNERLAPNQARHNSEGPDFDAIRAAIARMPKVRLYTLRSHGGDAPDGEEAVSSPSFAGAGAHGDQQPAGFNAKVQHLQLLRQIRAEFGERLIGIYGSTSGTLDAAALIGIRTLSLHDFGSMNDQDQRELIMQPFKSVVRRNGKDRGASAVEAMRAWMDDAYAGPVFDGLGGVKPVYSRATTGKGPGRGKQFKEDGVELPDEIAAVLGQAFNSMVGGIEDALAEQVAVDAAPIALVRGAATGVGMNCLIHTMVQLAGGAPAAPNDQVRTIRETMVACGAAAGDEMLDPYEAGAGAALMQQFRQTGNFRTQILEWTGGALRVHPVIGGGGPVRLLLHAGNHFEPVWGNNGRAIQPTDGVGDADAEGGELDADLQRAIAASLGKGAPQPASSGLGRGGPSGPSAVPAVAPSLGLGSGSREPPPPSPLGLGLGLGLSPLPPMYGLGASAPPPMFGIGSSAPPSMFGIGSSAPQPSAPSGDRAPSSASDERTVEPTATDDDGGTTYGLATRWQPSDVGSRIVVHVDGGHRRARVTAVTAVGTLMRKVDFAWL